MGWGQTHSRGSLNYFPLIQRLGLPTLYRTIETLGVGLEINLTPGVTSASMCFDAAPSAETRSFIRKGMNFIAGKTSRATAAMLNLCLAWHAAQARSNTIDMFSIRLA
ncbi:uncharacterized protein BJ212DRAFT_76822 [Suillus subaureus]|uniref:Uncharacterized protein n=1 Tax=Suillus subaureus TaxID=48587 RepID=A0A9P7EET8_9AGAM|nr:uncharacterized protein BJ212DRAFT_248688 [Suillus subaureus]XP_041194878.1 uncharacterized protein BJ212DRAFT_76822 [Suillus subaureus]KAG1797993.1 hypothetical protein BJ212DRAFT_248688 [Suillus subaureus]KAG1819201.1 hypothetical protein BJ212DRAFT_76822 [Suillus subaureus]